MKIDYVAQSGFLLQEKKLILGIDLWLNNPLNKIDFTNLPKISHLFVTHDHADHGLEDMIKIANENDSKFIAIFELAQFLSKQGVKNVEPAGIGGWFDVDDIKVKLVQALHSSNLGAPVGFLMKLGSQTIYHMGDTAYFSDLKVLGQENNIDILFVPIGSRFTMGPYEAVKAVIDLNPRYVIPMHYNTFPQIKQDPTQFKSVVESQTDSKVVIIAPGESVDL